MRIAVVGTGYVGLVTGTCLAETGHRVICVDNDERKISTLLRGEIPIYEPGLTELLARNRQAGRMSFTTDLPEAVAHSGLIFLTVGTPPASDGSLDLGALWSAVDAIAPHLKREAIVVLKSTVPVGTNAAVTRHLEEVTGRVCAVASNPEFLKEGTAVEDFMKPDRIVIGIRQAYVEDVLRELYEPYLRTDRPLLAMAPESAEMTKYVANALLATKISFINEMANLCERIGADINEVRRGIGYDARLGFAFLFPGVGYGGSCFPKDVRALAALSRTHGLQAKILDAVQETNRRQAGVLIDKMLRHYGGKLAGLTIAVWGLAFKPGTDDIREAPALAVLDRLLAEGVSLRVYDPVALENARHRYGSQLVYCAHPEDAVIDADGLAIVTEWKQFLQPNFEQLEQRMRQPVIFDGRNLYDLERMAATPFTYYSIGRTPVFPRGDSGWTASDEWEAVEPKNTGVEAMPREW